MWCLLLSSALEDRLHRAGLGRLRLSQHRLYRMVNISIVALLVDCWPFVLVTVDLLPPEKSPSSTNRLPWEGVSRSANKWARCSRQHRPRLRRCPVQVDTLNLRSRLIQEVQCPAPQSPVLENTEVFAIFSGSVACHCSSRWGSQVTCIHCTYQEKKITCARKILSNLRAERG